LRASGRKAKSIAIGVSNRLTPYFSAQLAYAAGKTLINALQNYAR
jgi:hypothetical protein